MVSIKQVEAYLRSKYTFFYCTCKDQDYFLRSMKEQIGKNRSLFVWKPNSLIALQYYDPEINETAQFEPAAIKRINEACKEVQFASLITKLRERTSWFKARVAENESENKTSGIQCSLCPSTPYIPRKSVVILEYGDKFLSRDPEWTRFVVDGITEFEWATYDLSIVVYSPTPITDQLVQTYGVELELEPQDSDTIGKQIHTWISKTRSKKGDTNALINNEQRIIETITPTLKSMYPFESSSAITLALVKHGKTGDPKAMLNTIEAVKAQSIQDDMLRWVPEQRQMDPKFVCGMDNLFEWLQRKSFGMSDKARKLGLKPPKGLILCGPPGTGKSMVCKAMSHVFGLPTIFMDMSAAFRQFVGESEARIKQALKKVDDQNGVILVIDEADKVLSGRIGNSGDSGTSDRVKGTLLTWLQEHTSNTFVVLTMNNGDMIPPEFTRKGRFDGFFYTETPDAATRRDIIISQFAQVGLSVDDLKFTEKDLDAAVKASEGFNGAELEVVVNESRELAYISRESVIPTIDEVLQVIRGITPQAEADAVRLEASMDFCKKFGTPVKKPSSAKNNDKVSVNFNIE